VHALSNEQQRWRCFSYGLQDGAFVLAPEVAGKAADYAEPGKGLLDFFSVFFRTLDFAPSR
jgi:hypothetical protein